MKTISENGFEFQGETKISDIFFQVIEYKLSASPSLETSVVYAKQLLLNFCQRANERWAGQMLLFCIYIYIYTIGFFLLSEYLEGLYPEGRESFVVLITCWCQYFKNMCTR